ncbi:MAG: hypothetical protein QXP36_11065, partial [Conexivisphaerales archaeon]
MERIAFPDKIIKPDVLSQQQFESHLSIYREALNRFNTILENALESSDFAGYYNFCKLHSLFFSSLNRIGDDELNSVVFMLLIKKFNGVNELADTAYRLSNNGANWIIGAIQNKVL